MNEQITASPKKARGLGKATIQLRHAILRIIEDIDPPLTVRQIYYQCEVRGAVGKTDGDYDKVQRQVLLMRREGLIAYETIADNTRWMRKPRTYASLADCLTRSQENYRAAVWHQLDHYIEVWLEKDALAGVLLEETDTFDVPLMVCRGYSSETFAYEAAVQMYQRLEEGKQVFVYYLGDHDPSGWHAGHELERKLNGFLQDRVAFKRLAIDPSHIDLLDLPTRPTKRADSRVKQFEQTFGAGAPSCELDALHPKILRKIVRSAIEAHLPDGWLQRIELEERAARDTLRVIVGQLPQLEAER